MVTVGPGVGDGLGVGSTDVVGLSLVGVAVLGLGDTTVEVAGDAVGLADAAPGLGEPVGVGVSA